MKTIFAAFIFVVTLALAIAVYAAPYLVSDPQSGVTSYQLTGWTPATVSAQADGSLRMDVATAAIGTTSLTIQACNVWGCSVSVPFAFTRPAALNAPAGIKLVAE